MAFAVSTVKSLNSLTLFASNFFPRLNPATLIQQNFPFLDTSSEEILSAASKPNVNTVGFYERTIICSDVDGDVREFLLSFVNLINFKIVFEYTLFVVLFS